MPSDVDWYTDRARSFQIDVPTRRVAFPTARIPALSSFMAFEEILAIAPMWYVAFLLSLTCHEAAHALVADWGGDSTAALGGQVTLNPVPHIQREPVGTVLVPIISLVWMQWMIGWASVPASRGCDVVPRDQPGRSR